MRRIVHHVDELIARVRRGVHGGVRLAVVRCHDHQERALGVTGLVAALVEGDPPGFRLAEVPIHFKNRARDASKLTFREIYMAVLNFALLRVRYGFRPRRRPEPTRATP